jgi:hypothetical protein
MKPAAEGPLPFALFCTSQNLLRLQNAIKLQSYKSTKAHHAVGCSIIYYSGSLTKF